MCGEVLPQQKGGLGQVIVFGSSDDFNTVLALSWGQFLTFGKKSCQVIRRVTNPSRLGDDLVCFASDLASSDVARPSPHTSRRPSDLACRRVDDFE
jgi:hypothetical protein